MTEAAPLRKSSGSAYVNTYLLADRMDGFKLYVTNTTTTPPNGYLCYEDHDPDLPDLTQTIPCNQLGKYVIYYDTKGYTSRKEGPIVELCYVAINDNVASDGLVYLHPIASGNPPASIANDGNYTSCSKTTGVNVTVQVDLMKRGIGNGMYVTFGEPTGKEGHHVVYASNNSNTWNIGTVLYKERSLPPEIKFNAVFRYLTYVFNPDQGQPSAIELCEIGISECPYGQFGRNCSQFCEGCFLSMCNPVNGLCDNTSICSPGYIQSAYCNVVCDDGYFGSNCSRLCNCATGNCSVFTGNCPEGCANGWRGEACDQG
ncbi:uncharacterized protein LOC134686925 [Mytilus trossulus]|uniref:uncharacterized protein LOC134686925 n=1 Tax=Mytilus trossulus TaxID=6551 RepID=UPI003004F98C